ncbi:MAG: hypothetical protein JXR83_02945 [Deltaproteobacteria bacterium]|nr:hypothetical protein [Deltaproteobacteria bacterium]
MNGQSRQAVAAIALCWIGCVNAGLAPASPAAAALDCTVGPGSGSHPLEGRLDHEPGAVASALLVKSGESALREARQAQRDRARALASTLARAIAALVPEIADSAIGRQRAARYPAPICPQPQATRGPPAIVIVRT